MTRRIVATAIAAMFVAMILAAPASASCAADANVTFADRLREGATVFVGTVRQTTNEGRAATVKVLEVWKGGVHTATEGPLPAQVTVSGSPVTDPNIHSSVDRIYETGKTYLFVPESGARTGDDASFTESSCSATTEFNGEVAAYRPTGVRPVATTTPDVRAPAPSNNSWPGLGGLIAVAALAGGIAILRRGGFRSA